jgi:hypothetical protein
MDDTLDIVAVFNFNQDDVAPFALGDDVLLQNAASPRRPDDGLQLFQDLTTRFPELLADGGKRRRRGIEDFSRRVEA